MALLLKKVERPRDLKWYQAGALLYGDWGTSKAYVLGIAFALGGHASWFLLGLMSALTALVGICYMVICRYYPDGGGVYSSVKTRSQFLAVIGAFLLIADYVVTASISSIEAFHYFGVHDPEKWAVISIAVIGILNWIGPGKGSSIAAAIAVAASLCAGVLFLSTLPHLPQVDLQMPKGNFMENWQSFVGIVLALSGVEAVANMTGIMKLPVEKTSRMAILPVLIEVSVLTFLLGIAMNAVPGLTNHIEDMLRALGNHYIGTWYGNLISFVFGLLLLSATNTAVLALVNVQYAMAKDREMPFFFTRLNRFGMPMVPLLIAVAIPVAVLAVESDLVALAALYAIGVVGAITLNLGACATNWKLNLKPWERGLLSVCALLLFFIEISIAFEKRNALLFVGTIIGAGLLLRLTAKKLIAEPLPDIVPQANVLTVSEAREIALLYKSSAMVALRTVNPVLLSEAILRAKGLHENAVYISYVEEIPSAKELPDEAEPSHEALKIFALAEEALEKEGLTCIPVWQLGINPGQTIANVARELGVNTVMIGTTRRNALVSLLRGDVLRNLSTNLPKDCRLVITG